MARTPYADKELVYYLCVDSPACTVSQFGARLEASSVRLRVDAAGCNDALLVEPIRKQRQFFSVLFVRSGAYRMMHFADLSTNGLTVLPLSRNGYYLISERMRESGAT